MFQEIKESLQELYLEDKRPWLVGFSGGKDSIRHPTDWPSLIFDAGRSIPTEDVWVYLLQNPNPWGGDNRPLYKVYASASNGECPIEIDTSTPICGNSRFGCWRIGTPSVI